VGFRAIDKFVSTRNPGNNIRLWGFFHAPYYWDWENIRGDENEWEFITIPPPGQGSYSVRHEVSRDKIKDANIKKGDKCQATLSDIYLGTRWWTFASLEELDGVRLRAWRTEEKNKATLEMLKEADLEHKQRLERANPEIRERIEADHIHLYGRRGSGPTTMGENPRTLAMVPEVWEVEFEVV
jgi:hypothetical protein